MSENKPKVAVILSGCGVFDGAEIHESVLTLLALDRAGAEAVCFAPDIPQAHVINHLTGQEMAETRSVLAESARITRGSIQPLSEFDAAAVDALILPGGFGAAKNLSNFAFKGTACTVNEDVEKAIRATRAAGKPIGALCIAPAIMAKLFGSEQVELTIGSDAGTAEALQALGARHHTTSHGEVIIDQSLQLVTSPCYMLDATISQIADGADNTVKALLGLVRS